MTYIPSAREEGPYHESNLNEIDKEFIKGYDYALNEIKTLFEGNTYVFDLNEEVGEDCLIDLNKIICKYSDQIKEMIEEWLEMSRNEIIVSIIDDYEDE